MKELIINDFLKNGRVDNLDIGMWHHDFVYECVQNGKNIELYSFDDISKFYDYGFYDICFYNEQLNSISLTLNPNQKFKYRLTYSENSKSVNQKTRFSDFIRLLNLASIKWSFDKIVNETDLYIITEGGVSIIYSYENEEEELVHVAKVGISNRTAAPIS